MKIDKKNPSHWLLLLQQGLYTLLASTARRLRAKPARPKVVLYGHQLSGNLKALYEEWRLHRQQDFSCLFLSLDPEYSQVLQSEGVRVLQCSRLKDMLEAGRADVIITDHGLHAMRPFLSLTDIILIDVWHGIPYKGFTPDDFRVQHRYQETWVSSPLLKSVYEQQYGFRRDMVINLGYARADKLFRGDSPEPDIRASLDIPAESKLVLYAPTWQQDDSGREMFPFGMDQESFISALETACRQNGATLLIRSHLNARISQGDHRNVRYCSMRDYPDSEYLLQCTDLLICDWSSISFDYLALDRPTVFLDVEPPFKNGFSLGPEYRFGEIVSNKENLLAAIDTFLGDPERYRERHGHKHREITAAAYGGNTDGKAAARQWEHLADLLAARDA